jgi:hypothetical protein
MSRFISQSKRGTRIRLTGKDASDFMKSVMSPEKQVADWNKAVRVGQEVDYRSDPGAEPQRFETRSVAEVLSGHTAVVWLEGKSGCVTLEACTPVAVVEGGAA